MQFFFLPSPMSIIGRSTDVLRGAAKTVALKWYKGAKSGRNEAFNKPACRKTRSAPGKNGLMPLLLVGQ